MERDGMTDRAIKEEREVSQRSTNLLRCSTPYVYYPCIYTLAMLLTQRYYLRMYVRTYVSTYVYRRYQPTIQSALLSLPRRPPSTGCFFVCRVRTYWCFAYGAMTKRKRLRLFTLGWIRSREDIKWITNVEWSYVFDAWNFKGYWDEMYSCLVYAWNVNVYAWMDNFIFN